MTRLGEFGLTVARCAVVRIMGLAYGQRPPRGQYREHATQVQREARQQREPGAERIGGPRRERRIPVKDSHVECRHPGERIEMHLHGVAVPTHCGQRPVIQPQHDYLDPVMLPDHSSRDGRIGAASDLTALGLHLVVGHAVLDVHQIPPAVRGSHDPIGRAGVGLDQALPQLHALAGHRTDHDPSGPRIPVRRGDIAGVDTVLILCRVPKRLDRLVRELHRVS